MNIRKLLLMLAVALAVAAVGVVMAATGASPDAYMAMVLLGAGAVVSWMVVRYYKNPTYISEGKEHTVGRGMLAFLLVFAVILLLGGLYMAIVGLPAST